MTAAIEATAGALGLSIAKLRGADDVGDARAIAMHVAFELGAAAEEIGRAFDGRSSWDVMRMAAIEQRLETDRRLRGLLARVEERLDH